MEAIIARDRDAGISGLSLAEMPHPHAAENDVIVRVHAAGFTADETATDSVDEGDAGARALAKSPYFGKLTDLTLTGNPIGPRAAAVLRERFGDAVRLD